MANRMIAIALLSVGMVAMNESATIWKSVLNSEVLHRVNTAEDSRLFTIYSSEVAIYPTAEIGNDSQLLPSGMIGMAIHSCSDEYGIDWEYVIFKQQEDTHGFGWVKAEKITPISLSAAPAGWVRVHLAWGGGDDRTESTK